MKSAIGFTLIEILVVLAIIATLLTLVSSRYFGSVDRAKTAALKENLGVIRDAIDKHFADTGKYPDNLDALVAAKYLRKLPVDPLTERTDTWVVVAPTDSKIGGVYDIKSGAPGASSDGTAFQQF
jgi:general secretion pathway protein G